MKTAYEYIKEQIQNVKPQMAYAGGSVEEWKKEARKKLSELLGMHKFEKVNPETEIEYETKADGYTETRFTFQSEKGYRVPCHLLLPDGVENPPLMICLQGHSTGMHISIGKPIHKGDEKDISCGDRDFCIRAVKEGYAAVAMEQRDFGECGGNGVMGPGCFEEALTAIIMGRTTIGERVWDLMRLIDVLETEFNDKFDVNAICLMGNSGGGTVTAYSAALEDRIILAMPSCSMCAFKDSIGATTHCTCNYVPHIAEFFDMGDLMAMAAPKYFVQVSGVEDDGFPIFAAEDVFRKGKKAYEKLGADDRCILVKGNGGHRFYADDAWPFVHKYMGK